MDHVSAVSLALVAAVLITGVTAAFLSGVRLRFPDEHTYHKMANSVRVGNGFLDSEMKPTARRGPGYPIVLSILYRTSCRPLAAKLLNAVAYALVALLLARLAGRIHPLCEIMAPLMVLLYPAGFYAATTLYPQTLGTLMLAAILFVLYGYPANPARAALAGILFGFLCLTIPSFLLVAPLLGCCVFLRAGDRVGKSSCATAVFLLAACLAIAPWTARNMRQFGAFVPVSCYSGVNLLLGNSENADPAGGSSVDISRYRRMAAGTNEIEEDAAFRRYAVEWIVGNPGRAAALYAKKVANYFNFRNNLRTSAEMSPTRGFAMFATYYPLLALAVARIFLARRHPMSPAEIAAAVLYFGDAVLSAMFFTRIRFRIPFDALLALPAASMIAILICSRRRRGSREHNPEPMAG